MGTQGNPLNVTAGDSLFCNSPAFPWTLRPFSTSRPGWLRSLKHQGALTTDQFLLLKDKAKEGLVKHQVFENLSQPWKLRCDGSVDGAEYEQDLRIILKEM